MNCKKHKQNIVLFLYGELNEQDKKSLEEHIKQCAECARDLEYTRKVFGLLDETKNQEKEPQPNWERCWQAIENNTMRKEFKKPFFRLVPNWAYAAAAVLAVFILGIMAGREWFTSQEQVLRPEQPSAEFVEYTLNQHLDELKPMLLEYANYPEADENNSILLIDQKAAQELLIQNILLKEMIAQKYPSAGELLEDLDLVLKEIANQEDKDDKTPLRIKNLIKEREVMFKMEILQKL
jgi:hypothetical protein